MFITFEGVEGSGKTTQIDLLYRGLVEEGFSVVKTREPGGTVFGESLRQVLLHEKTAVNPLSELLVFAAMRAQLVEEVIRPALKEGKVVLCDRFTDATYAYQGYGRGLDLAIIGTLNNLVTGAIRPDLTILLNCPVRKGLQRKIEMNSTDRFEREDTRFHDTIKDAYEKMALEEPQRFYVVDGTGNREDIHGIIRKKVGELLNHGV